jgi:cysteine desulfurase
MLANNETGVLQPVEEISEIARAAGAFFHIDAVQGAGKVPFDVRRFGCHLLSISAHKVHGPKGVGAMFVRRGTPLEPLVVGGSHERRQRAGTENLPGIVGLAKAIELAMLSLEDGTIDRLALLRDRLEAGLLRIPGTGLNGVLSIDGMRTTDCHPAIDCHPERAQRVEGPAVSLLNDKSGTPGPAFGTWESANPVPRVANTTNIWFDQLEGEALVIALDLKGIAVSGGSACHSGATEPSHVLMAMGLDKTRARASLRFSLLKTATEADVDHVLQVVPEAVERLRALSPVAAGTLG